MSPTHNSINDFIIRYKDGNRTNLYNENLLWVKLNK